MTEETKQVSLLERLVTFSKQAGQPKESTTERDGFLSYKSETHALGMGLAGGFFFAAEGETKLLSMVYGASVYGKLFGESGSRRRIARDIKREPQYALAGVVVGALMGLLIKYTPLNDLMQSAVQIILAGAMVI